MLICRNAKGVHGQRKVGNPCFKLVFGMTDPESNTACQLQWRLLNQLYQLAC